MGVSPEILAVPRPVNTIVEDRHINTVKRYAIRERAGIKYIAGGNPQPRNGKVIGHIINFQYVPIPENCHCSEPSILSYGAATLARNFSKDIYSELLSVFSANDATIVISILQFIYPNITSTTMSKFYNKTFVKKIFSWSIDI